MPLIFAAVRREATARLVQPPTGISRIHDVEEPISTDSACATIHRGNT